MARRFTFVELLGMYCTGFLDSRRARATTGLMNYAV